MTTPEAMLTFPAPPPPEHPRRRRLLAAIAVLWALVLLGSGIWYSFHGSPTVRDQTTIAQAQPRVDEAIGKVLAAAGTGAVPAVTGYQKSDDCDVTPVRAGARYGRAVRFFTPLGAEPELLARIAAGLPAQYHPKLTARELTADAGYYVALDGAVEQPGVVVVVANTGCRPLGHPLTPDPTGEPRLDFMSSLEATLAPLGPGPIRWTAHDLPCGITTIEGVISSSVDPATLRIPAGEVVVSHQGLVAFREANVALSARRTDSGVTVTATTGSCQ